MRRVLTRVSDLFFATRIAATAQALGVKVEELGATAPQDTVVRCHTSAPDLVILDLHGSGEPLEQARALKADERTQGIPIVGFYSHLDQALRAQALEAGVDRVLPRSAFTAQLANILGGEPTAQ